MKLQLPVIVTDGHTTFRIETSEHAARVIAEARRTTPLNTTPTFSSMRTTAARVVHHVDPIALKLVEAARQKPGIGRAELAATAGIAATGLRGKMLGLARACKAADYPYPLSREYAPGDGYGYNVSSGAAALALVEAAKAAGLL